MRQFTENRSRFSKSLKKGIINMKYNSKNIGLKKGDDLILRAIGWGMFSLAAGSVAAAFVLPGAISAGLTAAVTFMAIGAMARAANLCTPNSRWPNEVKEFAESYEALQKQRKLASLKPITPYFDAACKNNRDICELRAPKHVHKHQFSI